MEKLIQIQELSNEMLARHRRGEPLDKEWAKLAALQTNIAAKLHEQRHGKTVNVQHEQVEAIDKFRDWRNAQYKVTEIDNEETTNL